MKKSFNEIQSEKEELNEYGYPLHKDSDYKKRPEMNFGTWVGLILVLTVMIAGILKLVGIIWLPSTIKIIHPQHNLIPELDNKVLRSFYKKYIVRDHEQRQSEMTAPNKDKRFLSTELLLQ